MKRPNNEVRDGHQGMFEVPFSVDTGALAMPGRMDASAADFLAAFDAAGRSTHEIEREVYSHSRRTSYMLTAADFR